MRKQQLTALVAQLVCENAALRCELDRQRRAAAYWRQQVDATGQAACRENQQGGMAYVPDLWANPVPLSLPRI